MRVGFDAELGAERDDRVGLPRNVLALRCDGAIRGPAVGAKVRVSRGDRLRRGGPGNLRPGAQTAMSLRAVECVGWLAAAVLIAGCAGHAGPAAPTRTESRRHVYGIVTDGDDASPVAGAMVTEPSSLFVPVSTDGNGYYTFDTAPRAYPGTSVNIAKTGYDVTYGWVAGIDDERHDFRIYRQLNVTAGSIVHVGLSDDSSLCDFDDEFRCRPVHIASATSGTLTVEMSVNDSTHPCWLLLGDARFPVHPVTRAEMPVTSGTVLTLQLLRDTPAPPVVVELRTSLSN